MLIARTKIAMGRAKVAVATTVAASIMMFSLGVAVPSSGASTRIVSASPSAFCQTIISYHPKTPTGTNYKTYQTWAKSALPFFQKLANTAPKATAKKVLNQFVTVIKHLKSSNYKAYGAYLAANQAKWVNGWKAVTAALVSCAKSLY